MTKQNWLYAGVIVLGILGGLAWFGLTPFLYSKTVSNTTVEQLGNTVAGGTFDTAHTAAIAVNLANIGANGTSSSILNGSANDYYVTGIKVGCENVGTSNKAYVGTGLSALTLSIATSSTAAPASNANANLLASPLTIATTTAYFSIASSTVSNISTSSVAGATQVNGITSVNDVWLAGSYMTFTVNATNTALCTFGVDYFSS